MALNLSSEELRQVRIAILCTIKDNEKFQISCPAHVSEYHAKELSLLRSAYHKLLDYALE